MIAQQHLEMGLHSASISAETDIESLLKIVMIMIWILQKGVKQIVLAKSMDLHVLEEQWPALILVLLFVETPKCLLLMKSVMTARMMELDVLLVAYLSILNGFVHLVM